MPSWKAWVQSPSGLNKWREAQVLLVEVKVEKLAQNQISITDLKSQRKNYFSLDYRYQKSLNRLLKVCYVPSTSTALIAFFSSFFAAAINSPNEANNSSCTYC